MNIIRRYLSADSEQDEDGGSDIVEKLVDRFQSATRTEDKRDALRTLKSLSKKYRLEVGTKAMAVFLDALRSDREDPDSVFYCLEALYSVMNDGDVEECGAHELVNVPADLGSQFTEIFIKQPENVSLIFGFVDAYELHVRRNTLRLLTLLLTNQLKGTQEVILQCPRAISRLVDLLSDPREALRNDTLLLLIELTKSHVNIQKIVAFENTFERLFAIIQSEGLLDGGVVVEDCLRLMWQLLEGNVPNQILFRENNFIQRLLPLFEPKMMGDATDYQSHWPVQKVVNLQLALHVVRALLSARKQNQETRLCQTSMYKCGLLSALCAIVMAIGVPADVLNKAIYVLADVIRGCPVNQEYLAQVIAPSEPPQPVITILVISMVTERQELPVRAAALYCFQCYVTSNRETQSAVIQTLLPKSAGSSEPISMGQLLFGGLFSDEVLSVWFSAIALSHCILDNPQLKEELLRFQMALGPDGSSIRLLQHCLSCFERSNRFQARIGMLQFLCSWLAYCPEAVHCFLSGPPENDSNSSVTAINAASADPKSGAKSVRGSNWSMLLAEAATLGDEEEDVLVRGLITLLACICIIYNPGDVVGFDRATLKNTLERRIGLDTIVEYLSQVSKAESFTTASKHPELKCQYNSDLVFDYSFTLLFKRLEYEVIHLFQPIEFGPSSREPDAHRTSSRMTESQIAAYEEKLAIKDAELNSLRTRLALLETEMSAVQNRSHLVPNHSTCQPQPPVFSPGPENYFSHFTSQAKPNEVDEKVKLLEEKLSQSVREKEELKSVHDDLLLLLHDQDVKLTRLKRMVRNLGGSLEDLSEDEHSAEATTHVAQTPYTSCDHPSVQTASAASIGSASFNIPRTTTMQMTHPSSSTPTPTTHLTPSKQGQQTSHFVPNTTFPAQTYYSVGGIYPAAR
ncbi:hypothetical protein CRM22_004500 [Opisthorchis felineus]|uniref:Uncharacterized protein n=2 Tax=Opisthorchis felineus TaxID=147828 RepID=A0A4S2LVV4_OPIFE|nr:hypothetical protein CRM22_004500 [Opisthorchis felineus]